MKCISKCSCAFKQGYSWLMDEIAPALAGKPVARLQIDFAKDVDSYRRPRHVFSRALGAGALPGGRNAGAKTEVCRWRRSRSTNLMRIRASPTYRVHALDANGAEILKREFTVTTAMQAYNGIDSALRRRCKVETGWVHLQKSLARDSRSSALKPTTEEFWDHYQNATLPRIYHFIMAQAHGETRLHGVSAALFDTLRIDFRMSEPDYNLRA